MRNVYKTLGMFEGTAVFFDKSKPDSDKFLDFREKMIPEDKREEYLDGFMEGRLGQHQRKFRELKCFSMRGSDEHKGDDE